METMNSNSYESLEACIDSFAVIDKDLDFVVHDLEAGDEVESDIHTVDERVVANNGKFEITIDKQKYLYDAKDTKGYALFYIQKNTEHSLITLMRTKYYVFKGK